MSRRHLFYLLAAVLLGLLVRLPGVSWGSNFPLGWYGHHPDEYTHAVNAESIVYPALPPRWSPHPYPKGLAAHVAVPMVVTKRLQGAKFDEIPHPEPIIVWGRVVSSLYGAGAVLAIFLLASVLFRDPRVPLFSAWITALGGLHVTQSHFFISDIPAQFWLLIGLYCLARELRASKGSPAATRFLAGASFAFGVAFGLKLTVAGIPSLVLVMLRSRPWLMRTVNTAVYAFAGFVLVNFASYTAHDIWMTVARGGVTDPWQYSRLASLYLYAIELPSVVSLPVVLLALVGGVGLTRRLVSRESRERLRFNLLVGVLPVAVSCLLILKTDHFPRHLVTLAPWIFMAAAWALARIVAWLGARRWSAAWAVLPLVAYLGAFVYDGERVFIEEPRNHAARWIQANVPEGEQVYWRRHEWIEQYEMVPYPDVEPRWLVMEMINANHYLRGLGTDVSYPRDYSRIFDAISPEWIDAHQAIFQGTAGYEEVARFAEGYFMPEYALTDEFIGNRSRNYVTEVVIFRRAP